MAVSCDVLMGLAGGRSLNLTLTLARATIAVQIFLAQNGSSIPRLCESWRHNTQHYLPPLWFLGTIQAFAVPGWGKGVPGAYTCTTTLHDRGKGDGVKGKREATLIAGRD